MERKRLDRNVNDKMLCGVCSGLADYFNIDPTLVRLAWVVLGFMGGSGLLAYIIASIVIPVDPDQSGVEVKVFRQTTAHAAQHFITALGPIQSFRSHQVFPPM